MYLRWSHRLLSTFLGGLLVVLGLVVVAPAASAAPALPAGFVLRDQATGQATYDLTDFAYLPDNSVITIGKTGRVTWISPTGAVRTIATLPRRWPDVPARPLHRHRLA